MLTSTEKVFGIEQELILPSKTKLYFRVNYTNYSQLKDVKLGIQNDKYLGINRTVNPSIGKTHKISLIDIATHNKIKVHVIFESDQKVNRIKLEKPILVDLEYINKST